MKSLMTSVLKDFVQDFSSLQTPNELTFSVAQVIEENQGPTVLRDQYGIYIFHTQDGYVHYVGRAIKVPLNVRVYEQVIYGQGKYRDNEWGSTVNQPGTMITTYALPNWPRHAIVAFEVYLIQYFKDKGQATFNKRLA